MATEKRIDLTLPEYVKELGVDEFAKAFGVKKRAALNYLYDLRRPRPKSPLVRRLLDQSPLTWEGIYRARPKQRGSHA